MLARSVSTLWLALSALMIGISHASQAQSHPWLDMPGGKGPGAGKTIVLISGDEEYRSEEGLPQLARILSQRQGFHCVVLFAVDPTDGCVAPNVNNNIPGLEHLQKADLMVLQLRWRNLPDDQMKYIAEYAESGKPIIGLRTSTHAFNLKNSGFQKYSWDSKEPGYEGGLGRQILGETWIAHHGNHGVEGTKALVSPGAEHNPILTGISSGSIHVTTDVYKVRLPLPDPVQPLLVGQVLKTLAPDATPVEGEKNSPMLPVAWTRLYKTSTGKQARVFASTMCAAVDLKNEGIRRMLVNAVFWSLGMEKRIKPGLNVDTVEPFQPGAFTFRKDADWKPGKHPDQY